MIQGHIQVKLQVYSFIHLLYQATCIVILSSTTSVLILFQILIITVNWISSYDLSGINSSKSSDPDADGLNNETEFAYGSDPLTPDDDSYAPSYFIQNNNFIYIYRRWREAYAEEYNITYDFQITDNLNFPDWSASNITTSNSSEIDDMYNVTNSIQINSNIMYMRHRILFGD